MPDRDAALSAWAREAAALRWSTPFERVFDPEPAPQGTWFPGGRLNVADVCLDRHLDARSDRVALHWEGEPGDRRSITYAELHAEVEAFAAALAGLGVVAGDRVGLYLGMVPETVVAMLACARLGAVHCILFSALPADALADRLEDLDPKVLVTQDGSWRHGVVHPLKARADEALGATAGVDHTVVVRRTGIDVAWFEGDRWYHDLLTEAAGARADPVAVPADAPLLVVHLANHRGRPTGIVHRSGGLVTYTAALHRGLSTSRDDVFWCAVDIGWVAGQTHGLYGPLALGATTVLFEGTLDVPTHARTWEIIERYGVGSLVTTPSVVRNLRRWVDSPPSAARLDSLRLIVTAGEPIEPETREWLVDEVGGGRALVRDGWGQTELGGIVSVTPDADPALPDPGLEVVGPGDVPVAPGAVGELVLRHPWPGLFLGLSSDDVDETARYWSRPGCYTTGDWARARGEAPPEVLGRMDPVVSVLGQLVSANEVRDVLVEHPFVQSAEVVARPDPRSGQAVVACVVLDPSASAADEGGPDLAAVAHELRLHVHDTIGGLARPRSVAFLERIPDGVERTALRRALAGLCAATEVEVLRITEAQLHAAVAAAAAAAATEGRS